ncbi:GNAT family N-acetyltransferase [Ruegeria sp. HU-ET01832]|uniref:GNAT family N-acetyltransferase n=1 Tax=Ruegeria sp. HU-ET01832 TaxID=3135906 RepID=UPI0031092D33
MVHIRLADPTSDGVRQLVQAHFAHSETAGPAESNHTMDAQGLAGPDMRFWAVYNDSGPVGCGALKTLPDGTAEVKSVHVLSSERGKGLAREIMNHLANLARAEGVSALVLETGAAHLGEYDAARKLYEALGYAYCGPIYGYEADPNSAFMRLDLNPKA